MLNYERCPNDVSDLAQSIIDLYHADLGRVKLRLDLLFAFSPKDDDGDPLDPEPLKLHGYPASAVVKITNAKDRAKGMGDAEIVIDGRRWEEMSERERQALMDHELTHLEVKEADDGEGRPKLKMRLHDRQMGMFDSIAHRYGPDSTEIKRMVELWEDAKDVYFQGELFDFNTTFPAARPAAKAKGRSGKSGGGKITISGGGKTIEFKTVPQL